MEQRFGRVRHKGGSNENPTVNEACHAIDTIRSVGLQCVAITHSNTQASETDLDCRPLLNCMSRH